MTSAHTTLRELVTHLARAQRAFDAGRLDEAEQAIGDALAIDPHNVQAADLGQRIRKDREPAARRRAQAAAPLRTRDTPAPLQARAAPPERVSPTAWSAFEQRVRSRRADRAVAEAQDALARGDDTAARAALAELDIVVPGDVRRAAIVDALGHAQFATIPSPAAESLTVAARPIDLGVVAIHRDQPWDARSLAPSAPYAVKRRRSWLGPGIASVAIAASALLGFWLFAAGGIDAIPVTVTPAEEQSASAEPTQTPAPSALPEHGPSDFSVPYASAPPYVNELGTAVSSGTLEVPAETPAESAAVVPPPTAEVRQGTSGTSSPPITLTRPAPESGASGAVPARPPDITRAEPAPAPLDPPVAALTGPETRLSAGVPGGEPVLRDVRPVPAPPPVVPPPPAPAPASGGAAEIGAVRGVLDVYAGAYSALDADATQRVWPGVDVRGLRRAFDQLSAQTITFNRCEVNASGETAAAVCSGQATWVPKVGDRSPKSEPRTWRFALGRDDGGWVIDGVQVQR